MPLFRLRRKIEFPPAVLAEPEGLLAVGGDLSPRRLLAAYSSGIFPWYNEDDPILWWSPDPRTVLLPENYHVPKRLRRTVRKAPYRITRNEAFAKVMHCCASVPRSKEKGTWINDDMISAYTQLHEMGIGKSVEAWKDDELVGGVYGLKIGKGFFAESKFHTARDASKIVLAHLCDEHFNDGGLFIDAQVYNDHLEQFGFHEIPRAQYLSLLEKAVS